MGLPLLFVHSGHGRILKTFTGLGNKELRRHRPMGATGEGTEQTEAAADKPGHHQSRIFFLSLLSGSEHTSFPPPLTLEYQKLDFSFRLSDRSRSRTENMMTQR